MCNERPYNPSKYPRQRSNHQRGHLPQPLTPMQTATELPKARLTATGSLKTPNVEIMHPPVSSSILQTSISPASRIPVPLGSFSPRTYQPPEIRKKKYITRSLSPATTRSSHSHPPLPDPPLIERPTTAPGAIEHPTTPPLLVDSSTLIEHRQSTPASFDYPTIEDPPRLSSSIDYSPPPTARSVTPSSDPSPRIPITRPTRPSSYSLPLNLSNRRSKRSDSTAAVPISIKTLPHGPQMRVSSMAQETIMGASRGSTTTISKPRLSCPSGLRIIFKKRKSKVPTGADEENFGPTIKPLPPTPIPTPTPIPIPISISATRDSRSHSRPSRPQHAGDTHLAFLLRTAQSATEKAQQAAEEAAEAADRAEEVFLEVGRLVDAAYMARGAVRVGEGREEREDEGEEG